MHVIHSTGYISLLIQFVTFFIGSYALLVETTPPKKDLQDLLGFETAVNLVEFCFYVWMVYHFKRIDNITKYRYYDWFFTTPVMLFTFSMYLLILSKQEKEEQHDLYTLALGEKYVLAAIVLLNACMLSFGYLSEIGVMGTYSSTFLGFIPFTLMFYLIYENYAKHTEIGKAAFVYFVVVWALYGVAALMAYKIKNTFYNVLDVFSKNFFGLFLAYMILFR